ncbi:MAG TPA: gliding motility-associated C-terminal domain-containing protein [Bacteroidales bacterium]|nr:gliding motility-associated C-terminal domain-containing protein [Bacteroidales bacterium]HSA44877.1 gliding motility-associated C-terminal domain-containing protein [Bacteroidales bacterium]
MVPFIVRGGIPLMMLTMGMSAEAPAQLIITTQTGLNQYCAGCSYNEASILINEVMISPVYGDGSITGTDWERRGEWIELYNPDSCCPRDISCFFLGNNAPDGSPVLDYPGGFELPPGTIVPPSGYVIVRGVNAPAVPASQLVQHGGKTVEIVVDDNQQVCYGNGNRLWFPNNGGWFCFYDDQGIPQDAIYWNNQYNFEPFTHPCDPPGGCTPANTLASFTQIPATKKTYITHGAPITGRSLCRMPDGGPWAIDQDFDPTYGDCNLPPCLQTNPCTGTATVSVSGGTPPYDFLWSDCLAQNNATAVNLCGGSYCCTVTDESGLQDTAWVTIQNADVDILMPVFQSVCLSGEPLTLTGALPGGGTYHGPGISSNVFDPAAAGPGTHTVSYEYNNNAGCHGLDSANITVHPNPEIHVDPPLAEACRHASITFSLTGCTDYTWSPSEPVTILPDWHYLVETEQTTQFLITGIDAHGCIGTTQVTLHVLPDPVYSLPDTMYVCEGALVTAMVSTADTLLYEWNTGGTGQSLTVSRPGVYLVTVSNQACSVVDTVHVFPCTELWVPNAFTPGHNGINDVFLPGISGSMKEYELLIFSRWGGVVFRSTDPALGWDGSFKGETCKEDVYHYLIRYTPAQGGRRQKDGMVVLLR